MPLAQPFDAGKRSQATFNVPTTLARQATSTSTSTLAPEALAAAYGAIGRHPARPRFATAADRIGGDLLELLTQQF
jgi:hypothetical protein